MAETVVGNIALDLVIKNKINEQLEAIKQSASAPAQKLGEAIDAQIEKPMHRAASALNDSIGSAASKASQSIQNSFCSAVGSAENCMSRLSDDVHNINGCDIHIRTDEVESAAQNVRSSFESAFDDVNRRAEDMGDIGIHFHTDYTAQDIRDNIGSAMENVRAQSESTAQAVRDSIGGALENVRQQVGNGVDIPVSADIPDIGSQLEDSVNNIDTSTIEERINNTMSNIRTMLSNAEISSDPTQRLVHELELTEEKISIVHARWQELQSSLASASDADAAKIVSGLDKAESEMLRLASAAERLNEKLGRSSGADKLAQTVQTYEEKICALKEQNAAKIQAIEERSAALRARHDEQLTALREQNEERINTLQIRNAALTERLSQKNSGSIKKAFTSAFSVIKKTGNKALDSLRQRFGFVGKTANAMSRPVEKLGRTIKNTFRRVFVTATLFAAVRALKSAFGEIMEQNRELSDSLNQVKANLAAAFMPIMQNIMPALNTFMQGLATVTKQVAGFISGLFGTTYAQSAQAAQKLKNTAKTAQDTAKKVKMAMAGIDEMNILSAGNDNDSSNENDDEQKGIDWSRVDMSEPQLPDWAEKLKDAIKAGDWKGVGEIFAERVNTVFSAVDWERISKKINSGIQAVVDIINGFIGKIDWELLGDTFAGGINTITSAVNTFWDGINWDGLGTGTAKGLNQAVKKINWKALGKALTGKLKAAIDFLYAFTKNFDFSELGKGVGDAINGAFENIDFAKAGTALSNAIKGIFGFLLAFVYTVDWSSIGTKIWQFISNIDFTGIADRFFELLGAALGASLSLLGGFASDIVTKLREYFEEHFNKFDTGSLGLNIILGLLDGILEGLVNIGKWIYDHVLTPFVNGFKKAFDIHSPSKVMEKLGGYIIDGLFNAISEGIKEIKKIFEKMRETITGVFDKIDEWFMKKFTSAWTKIKNVFSGIGTWFTLRWNDVKDVFSAVGEWFSGRFTEAWDGIKKAFSGCRTFFADRLDEIHDVFGGIGDWFGKKWDEVKEKFSGVKDFFKEKFQQGYDAVTGVFKGLGGFFYGVWEDVSDKARDGMNWFMGRIEDSLNRAIDFLNRWGFELPNGDWFGLAIGYVNLPRLARGGLATAPTLAMVGDNKNASVDPEVIAPLSKLQGMVGSDPQVVELLRMILELLKNGMNVEIVNYLFRNSREFSREVLNVISADNARRGL